MSDEEDQPIGEYPDLPTGFTIKPACMDFLDKLTNMLLGRNNA